MLRRALSKLRQGLSRTRASFASALRSVVAGRAIDDDMLRDIERQLIEADVGVQPSLRLVSELREAARTGRIKQGEEALAHLKRSMADALRSEPTSEVARASRPRAVDRTGGTPVPPADRQGEDLRVILVVGVNGTGKTTTIAKLARRFQEQGRSVLLGACDTFRAGAVRQLEIWADRLGVEIVRGQEAGDPAAVAFDACQAAAARGVDALILDTAGRLHTQEPLMRQLGKIRDVAARRISGAPHETLLILDASTGQNAVRQAEQFTQAVKVSGVVLTKLDGTARGGVALAVREATGLPIRYVGVGERLEDLAEFDADAFVEALFEEEAPAPARG